MARLMYVGMTRSEETTILAGQGAEPSLLNQLGIPDLVSWQGMDDGGRISVAGGAALLPARVLAHTPDGAAPPAGYSAVQYTDPVLHVDSRAPLPARIRASSQASDGQPGEVRLSHDLGERLIPAGGGERWNDVGSAMHSYLGTRYCCLSPEERLDLAQRIVGRWGVEGLTDANALVAAGERLSGFLSEQHAESASLREVPVAWRNEANQAMEGWIDLLLESGDGYVLMDHKTYPGEHPVDHIREEYLGQMDAYRQAVLAATGKPVTRTLIHLPALGKMYSIEM
jgi:ATP-dependent helicase/nuclease subunit A